MLPVIFSLNRRLGAALVVVSWSIMATQVVAAERARERNLDEMVVTATRTSAPVFEATRSVTILDSDRIAQQSAISLDIGDILAKEVPGLGTSTEGLTNFTQNLRGRNFLVMVDGLPVSTPLMESARDLKIIDPRALERVEVVRGGTAAYGFGATGGLIHFITRDPSAEEITGFSRAGFTFSTEHVDDSLRWHTAHGASGQIGPIDFVVNGSFTQRDGFFDADGDRIPSDPLGGQGGLADTDEWNVLGKLGIDFDSDRQRIELLINNYDIEQETGFLTAPGNVAAGQKATAVRGEPLGNQTRTENLIASLTYEHRDLWGSAVSLQAYHVDYTATFPIVEFPTGQPAPNDFDNAGSLNEFEKYGTRLTIDSPLWPDTLGVTATWGMDFLSEESTEVVTGDNAVFGTPSLRDIEQDSLAGFLQLSVPIGDIGQIRGGVRHEHIELDVPTFTGPGGLFGPGGTVTGGELSYDATIFNLTGVYYLTEAIELFGGFSQGFSVADVRGVLRGPAFSGGAGGTAAILDPEAQEVDNYELGIRGDWENVHGSVVGFFSESELGVTFESFARLNRQPEEIWGIEAVVEADVHPQWTVGGTATWLESQTDLDGDGDLDEELPTRRVPPVKITGFVAYAPFSWWSNRLQLLYSGTREADGATNFAGAADEVDDAFVIVDYYASVSVGLGDLEVGVRNLLNEDYFPVAAQSFGLGGAFSTGQGRSASISYDISW